MSSALLGGRYELIDRLGAGGMGEVYSARDRLTEERVALKRVIHDPQYAPAGPDADPMSAVASTDATKSVLPSPVERSSRASRDTPSTRLALAREFSVLASLRHPNIISVLDYGFEQGGQPYFSMSLLSEAVTVLDAARKESQETALEYLFQILHALSYLHRHGILHRDLKPTNVLYSEGKVTVLDFGLAGLPARRQAGTPPYMAPEVLKGDPIGPASDLYAVGVIAYEILAGKHPFDEHLGRSGFMKEVLSTRPDLSRLRTEPPVANVVGRLLAKDPAERFNDASESIAAFAEATGQTPPAGSAAHLESYLQAAPFTGREAELQQLITALDESIEGHGSAWLVGGKSGIGKSRLLDELRFRALVRGALVLTGRAAGDGASLYQLFRTPVLRLSLLTELDDADAAILKAVYPEIGRIAGRPIPDAPPLDPQVFADRLAQIIEDLFRRYGKPIVLELEDCHLLRESASIIRRLNRIIRTTPLLILASYRDDERPDLPQVLPEAQVLTIEPLDRSAIEQLNVFMLGESLGRDKTIVSFLERETEGNAFFLVEVMRALAEKAGRLDHVAAESLPEKVFEGGIRDVVQRRLASVPEAAQETLRLAATLGRNLDLSILRAIDPGVDRLLAVCSNAAVLEGDGYEWRFAHDKLREGVLFDLGAETRAELHRRVGAAIETVYGDQPKWIPALAFHWNGARVEDKAVHYLHLAAGQSLSIGAPEKAVTFGTQAARLLGVEIPDQPEYLGMAIGKEMGEIHRLMGGRQPAELLDLPPLTEERIGRVVQVLKLIQPAAHISHQFELFALSVLKCMSLSLAHGIGPDTSFVFGTYAAVARGMTGDSRLGHELTRLAMNVDRRRDGRISSAVAFLHTWFINHWVEPVGTSLPFARQGSETGLEEGDVLYGCFNAAACPIYLNAMGAPLADVIESAERNAEVIAERVRVAAFHCVLERQLARALAGHTADRLSFTDADYDEERDVASICETTNINQIGYFCTAKTRLHYYYGEYERALDYVARAVPLQAAFQGQVAEWEFVFFHALSAVARAGEVSGQDRDRLLETARELRQKLEGWAEISEANFKHKEALVRAELHAREGHPAEAAAAYEEAVAAAAAHGFRQHQALAHERAAVLFLGREEPEQARGHAERALAEYETWGAQAKVAALRESWSTLTG